MFVNTHVFVNFSVVYKLWWGGGGERGGGGVLEHKLKSPSRPPASPQVRDLRISGCRA